MTVPGRAVSVLWPLALLGAFIGTFRTATQTTGRTEAIDCDRPIHESGPRAAGTDALERCLTLDPMNVELLTDLGVAYESCGRADQAEAAYRRGLTVDPRDGDLHVRLGELLLKRGDLVGARAEAESALRWHPTSAPATDLAARSSSPAETVQ